MASLKSCRVCNDSISSNSSACIHCGEPDPFGIEKAKKIVSILLLGAVGLYCYFSGYFDFLYR